MSGNCDRCGQYLGPQPTCPYCGHSQVSAAAPPLTPPSPFDHLPPTPASPRSAAPGSGPRQVVPQASATTTGGSGVMSARGVVTDAQPSGRRFAPGVLAVRVLVLIATIALVVSNASTLLILGLDRLLAVLIPIAIPLIVVLVVLTWLGARVPVGGCLGALLKAGATGALAGRRPGRDDGWVMTLDTGTTSETVRFAGDVPLQPNHEVVVHGFSMGGVRGGWLVQGLNPTTFTRIGRGTVGTIVLCVVWLPVLIWMASL